MTTSDATTSILTSTTPPHFLSHFYESLPRGNEKSHRPLVTLTFAQSLDAKIAGKGGRQLILSGKESIIMTHWMRTMHDAIMVGIGTALNDNPQLNTRHLPPRDTDPSGNPDRPYHLPRPIILDSKLRLPTDCKLLQNYKNGTGRRPWVVCSQELDNDALHRRFALENAGARVIPVPAEQGRANLGAMLSTLAQLGVQSLMVEGGASVIKTFFSSLSDAGAQFVDAVIVTVAPVFVGSRGVGYDADLESSNAFTLVHSTILGRDAVVLMKPSQGV